MKILMFCMKWYSFRRKDEETSEHFTDWHISNLLGIKKELPLFWRKFSGFEPTSLIYHRYNATVRKYLLNVDPHYDSSLWFLLSLKINIVSFSLIFFFFCHLSKYSAEHTRFFFPKTASTTLDNVFIFLFIYLGTIAILMIYSRALGAPPPPHLHIPGCGKTNVRQF